MARHDYTTLDVAIVTAITAGKRQFFAINTGDVLAEAEKLAAGDPAPAWRIVDRRLQALRKEGHIRVTRSAHPEKAGWTINQAATSGEKP